MLFVRARWVALLAFAVAAGGFAVVLLYQYVNVGAFGPFPNMYESIWHPAQAVSAVAKAVAATVAVLLLGGASRNH